jgi:hypothetical protein
VLEFFGGQGVDEGACDVLAAIEFLRDVKPLLWS